MTEYMSDRERDAAYAAGGVVLEDDDQWESEQWHSSID
ncbi:hypothetical protein SAMN05421757_1251 [Tropicimonas sediminicola]|uniref:Uncharacterized protein n=1 Tax=Tropicimonas sediminicola TaxID=1031541 RepID=A0A239MKL8_9RHOB|nr:hypothetical protein SAMN05421757_1251 [Tropicimonas sediminicola]